MDITTKRWQDLGNILLGAWLFVSPWVLNYEVGYRSASFNAYILGVGIVVFAAVAVYIPQVWEEGINMALGVWMIASPWVLGFSSERNIATNTVVVGVLVTALAAWAMVRDKSFEKWWHDHYVAH